MATKTTATKRASKGKRHHPHAESFRRIARAVRADAKTFPASGFSRDILRGLAKIFDAEAKRVRAILR